MYRDVIILGPEPWEVLFLPLWLGAAVGAGVLLHARRDAQDAAIPAPGVFRPRGQERTDVEANAIVDVRLPADRLTIQRLPAHEDVVGRIALDDLGQFAAKVLGGNQARFRAGFAGRQSAALRADPFAEIAVAQLFEQTAAGAVSLAEPMVVDERRETAAHAVPDVPDERRLVEQPAMAVEEFVGEPCAEIGGLRFLGREQFAEVPSL